MRDVAIVSTAQYNTAADTERNEIEILLPVAQEAIRKAGLAREEIEFTCSGSSDWLQGQPFAFVSALDAIGAWPPVKESHVEMDGAWAFYEAWVKIQTGEVSSALVYSFGKTSPGDLAQIQSITLDPYCVAPLWPDMDSISALQARLYLEASGKTERDLAEVVARCRRDALNNPHAVAKGEYEIDELLAEPYVASPLRAHDCPTHTDGATALVMVAGDRARSLCERPVWIRGIDHRVDPMHLGLRDLTRCASAELAAAKAGVDSRRLDFAEISAPYAHQELILRAALGLADDLRINPSGGTLVTHSMFACGQNRIIDAADRIASGHADRGLAHASQGPCLQQNLVCVLEGA
jgi:acetyl-CoA acetyltransferase